MNKALIKKHISSISEIVAGDSCFLREIIHPDRDNANVDYSLAYAYVEPGGRTLDHSLENESEMYYIISGSGVMHIGDECFDVSAGSSFLVPEGENQWVENKSEMRLEFLVIVNPPWRKEAEKVLENND